MIDNRDALAESVGFFHVVGGEQDRFAELVIFANDLPEQDAGLGIEAGAGLVEEEDLRIVHHGAGDGEALHHASGKAAHHLVGAISELELFQQGVRQFGALFPRDSEIGGVEGEDLAGSEREIQIGALRNYADQTLDCGLFGPDLVVSYECFAAGGADSRGEDPDCCRFTGAVWP